VTRKGLVYRNPLPLRQLAFQRDLFPYKADGGQKVSNLKGRNSRANAFEASVPREKKKLSIYIYIYIVYRISYIVYPIYIAGLLLNICARAIIDKRGGSLMLSL
jgi:hypothetical protein